MDDPALLELAQSPAALVAAFVFGTLWGSFANVCIYRWPPTDEHPHGRSVVTPGSHCGACGKPVRWYDNVPILSWLWLRGRCRDCGTAFSARYLLVEVLTGALFAAAWWFAVDGRILVAPLGDGMVRFGIGAAFAFVMVVVLFIDLDHRLILDKVTLPAIPIFWGLSLLLPERAWWEGLVGAAVGYGVVRAIADGYWLITKREGMGYGDGKLLAVVGALLGWKGVVVSLFGGSMLGVVIAIPAIVVARLRGRGDEPVSDPESVSGPVSEPMGGGDVPFTLSVGRASASPETKGSVSGPESEPMGGGDVPFTLSVGRASASPETKGPVSEPVSGPVPDGSALGSRPSALGSRSLVPDAPFDEDEHDPDPEEDPGLGQVELPFGPFLALAALFWWFAEPYVLFTLRQP